MIRPARPRDYVQLAAVLLLLFAWCTLAGLYETWRRET